MDGMERSDAGEAVFCQYEALSLMGGDEELLVEMLEILLAQMPEGIEFLRQAVQVGDAAAINAYAHKFKGSVASLGAQIVTRLARQLETMGAAGDVSEAASVFAELESEAVRMKDAFEEYLSKTRVGEC